MSNATTDGELSTEILAVMDRHRPRRIRRDEYFVGAGVEYEECQAGCRYEPGTCYEHMAIAIADELGFTQEWSDDVAGPQWMRYSRWVSKTTEHPGPSRLAAGLT